MHLCNRKNDAHESILESKITLGIGTSLVCLLLPLNLLIVTFQVKEEAAFGESGNYREFSSEFSVFCEDLSLSPFEDYETFDKVLEYVLNDDKYVCRFKNISKVVKKFVERRARLRLSKGQDPERYLQCGNENLREKSDHLIATFQSVSPHQVFEGGEKNRIIHWHKHGDNAFISEELHYHNGELKIPETRVYFVYTSVLINGSCADSRRKNVCNFYVRICVRDRWSERILIQKMGVYNSTNENFVTTLQVGSHILLQRDTTVFVRVSEANRLVTESSGNVFGIMPIR